MHRLWPRRGIFVREHREQPQTGTRTAGGLMITDFAAKDSGRMLLCAFGFLGQEL